MVLEPFVAVGVDAVDGPVAQQVFKLGIVADTLTGRFAVLGSGRNWAKPRNGQCDGKGSSNIRSG
jgi:hypothetical protein